MRKKSTTKEKVKSTSFKPADVCTSFEKEIDFLNVLNKEKSKKISRKDLSDANITWLELATIYTDHTSRFQSLSAVGNTISPILQDIPGTHSVRVRVKNPVSLIHKIIRKRRDEGKDISYKNYKSEITYLLGVRVLHLLKEDWTKIHQSINNLWAPKEAVANIRTGDDTEWTELYKMHNLKVDENDRNYRSVHYTIESSITKEVCLVEIQVRTLYEEAWSELDHILNYPYPAPQVVQQVLNILNRLAGTADEMAAFAKYSHNLHLKIDQDLNEKNREMNQAREELKKATEELDSKSAQNERVQKALKTLEEKMNNYERIGFQSPDYSKAGIIGITGTKYEIGSTSLEFTPTLTNPQGILSASGSISTAGEPVCASCGESMGYTSSILYNNKCLKCRNREMGGLATSY